MEEKTPVSLRDVAMVEMLYENGAEVFTITDTFSTGEKLHVMVNGDIQLERFV